jgi:hypothetical protein
MYIFAEISSDIVVADSIYLYIRSTMFDGWYVAPLDKSKDAYSAIKSNILDLPVVAIADGAFSNNTKITALPSLPVTITAFEASAFSGCTKLTDLEFPA